MQDENRENRTEPQEVVSWYVRPEGQEVVDCYVQPRPLPSGAAPQTPREPEKRSRKGLWIFLIAMGVLMLAVAAGVIWLWWPLPSLPACGAAALCRRWTAERETAATPAAS